MTNKDTAKAWFETGDFPTQEQFYQTFDWLRWKDEGLAIDDIANLQQILNSLQATINANLPSSLVEGGVVTILSDDGTNVVVGIPATTYVFKGQERTIPSTSVTIVRPAEGLFRLDVFYLDNVGFKVLKGVATETPVKPQLLNGLELTTILVGFDNNLVVEPMPGTPNLQAVSVAGNKTTKPLVMGGMVVTDEDGKPGITASVQEGGVPQVLLAPELGEDEQPTKSIALVTPEDLDGNYEQKFQPKNGTIALKSDIESGDLTGFRGVYTSEAAINALVDNNMNDWALLIDTDSPGNANCGIVYVFIGGWVRNTGSFRGYFASRTELIAAFPGGTGLTLGDWALSYIGSRNKMLIWDGIWRDADDDYGFHASVTALATALLAYGYEARYGITATIMEGGRYRKIFLSGYAGTGINGSGWFYLDEEMDPPVFDSNDEAFAAGLPVGSKYCTLVNGNFVVSTVKNSAYPWHHIFEIEIKEDDDNLTGFVDHSLSEIEQVDWGDGTVDTNITHEYASPGIYTIKVEISEAHLDEITSCDFSDVGVKRLIAFKWPPNSTEVVLNGCRMSGNELVKAFKILYENAPVGIKTIYLQYQEGGASPTDLTLINRAIAKGWTVYFD
ncbi:MAG: hypothetical protein JSR97_12560 [Verrucomicrobia bacterium]|nr:hypothetical protein [Verrucomicrobiota bacterium]